MMEGCMSTMLGNQSIVLCKGLQQLKEEHSFLREKLDELLEGGQSLEKQQVQEENVTEFVQKVRTFFNELETHSKKEETVLFPMMETYLGKDGGPIAVMEYEHEQARKTLQLFMDESKNHLSAQDNDTIRTVLSYAIQAYSLLSVHFMKEENVLFPMADQMLSEEEKATLNQNI